MGNRETVSLTSERIIESNAHSRKQWQQLSSMLNHTDWVTLKITPFQVLPNKIKGTEEILSRLQTLEQWFCRITICTVQCSWLERYKSLLLFNLQFSDLYTYTVRVHQVPHPQPTMAKRQQYSWFAPSLFLFGVFCFFFCGVGVQ